MKNNGKLDRVQVDRVKILIPRSATMTEWK